MALSKFISTVGTKLLTHIGTGIKNFFTYLGTTISKIVKTIATTIQNAFHSIFESIGNSIKNGDASKVGDLLIKVLIGSIVLKIRKFFKELFGGNKPLVEVDIFKNVKKVIGNIQEVLEGLQKTLTMLQTTIKANVILKIAIAVGILAFSLVSLSGIEKDKLQNALSAIAVLFTGMTLTFKAIAKSSSSVINATKTIGVLLGISWAVKSLAKSVVILSSMSNGEAMRGVLALMAVMEILTRYVNKITPQAAMATSNIKGLISLAIALKIMASTVKDLGKLSKNELIKGVSAIGALLTELVGFLKLLNMAFPNGTTSYEKIGENIHKTNYAFNKIASSLVILSIALKIMAGVVKDFGGMTKNQLIKGFAAMGAILTELGLFLVAIGKSIGKIEKNFSMSGLTNISKSNSKVGLFKIMGSLLVLSFALRSLSGTVKNISEIKFSSLAKSITAIGALMGELWLFSLGMNKVKPISVTKLMTLFAEIKIMGKISDIVKPYNDMNWDTIYKAITGIVLVTGALLSGIAALNKTTIDQQVDPSMFANPVSLLTNIKKLAQSLISAKSLAMAIESVASLANAMKTFKDVDWGDIAKGLVSLTASIGLFIILAKTISNKAKGSAIDVWQIANMAALIMGVGQVIANLSNIAKDNLQGLLVAAGILDTTLLVVLGFSYGMAKAMQIWQKLDARRISKNMGSISWGLIKLSFGIGVSGFAIISFMLSFAGALALYKQIGWQAIVGGIGAFVGVLTTLVVIAKILDGLNLYKSLFNLSKVMLLFSASVLALGSGMFLLATAISGLSVLGGENAKRAGEAFKNIIKSVAESIPIIIKQIGIGIIEILKVIKDSLPELKNILFNLFEAFGQVSEKFVETLFTTLIHTLEMASKFMPQIVNLLYDVIVKAIDALKPKIPGLVDKFSELFKVIFENVNRVGGIKLDPDVLLKMELAIGGFGVLLMGIGKLKLPIVPIMKNIGIISLVIAEIGLILAGFGALSKIPYLQEFIQNGGNLVSIIFNVLGKIIGSFIGGIAEGAFNSLPNIGTSLSSFANNAKDFIKMISELPNNFGDKISNLLKGLLGMIGTDFLNKLTGFSTLTLFGLDLSAFAKSVKPFLDFVASLSDNLVTKTQLLSNAVATLSEAKFLNSVANFLSKKNFKEFGKELEDLAVGLGKFNDELSKHKINVDTVNLAATAIEKLAEAYNKINAKKGIFKSLVDSISFTDFTNNISNLAMGLKDFSDNLGEGYKPEAVDKGIVAIDKLADIANKLTQNSNIFTQASNISFSIKSFSDVLPELALGMNDFSNKTDSIYQTYNWKDKIEKVTSSVNAIKTITEAVTNLKTAGPLIGTNGSKLEQVDIIKNFTDRMPELGSSLFKFAEQSKDINSETITNTSKNLITMVNTIKEIKTLTDGLDNTKSDSIIKFSESYYTFMSNMIAAINLIGAVDQDALTNNLNKMKSIKESLSSISQDDMNKITAMNDSLKAIGTAGAKGVTEGLQSNDTKTALTNAVNSIAEQISQIGNEQVKNRMFELAGNLIISFANGLNTKNEDIKNASSTISYNALQGLYTHINNGDTYNAGGWFVTGFVNGIRAYINQATQAAGDLGKDSLGALKWAIRSNSPSKETKKLGNYFGEGMVVGIKDYTSTIKSTSYDLGNEALTGLKESINNINDEMNMTFGEQPVIRPVLDMSELENGVRQINGLFDKQYLNANLNVGASIVSKRQSQNEMLNALNNLNKNIGNTNNTTYNINGITYDDGSNIQYAVGELVNAARIERRR